MRSRDSFVVRVSSVLLTLYDPGAGTSALTLTASSKNEVFSLSLNLPFPVGLSSLSPFGNSFTLYVPGAGLFSVPLIASSSMPGTFAWAILPTGSSLRQLFGASYAPGPGRQSRLRLRPREPLVASALRFRPFRWSRSWSFSARSVSIRSMLESSCSRSSSRLDASTRSSRSLVSRASTMRRCCSSLRISRFCCSPSRRCCTDESRSSMSMSLCSPSSRRSSIICRLFAFISLTLSLKTAALSLPTIFFSCRNLSRRSSSAASARE
mmetsp:Transcript_12188/g.32192  ORF Transcript_12188/g.32192 Transcript_12188/m.32192 type:complete len:266 (-) Transcript_12188:810-1607(-)